MSDKRKLIIVGSGPAGLTAGIYAARADLAPLIFEGSEPGGQLMGTTEIENFPGFPKGIMGPQLMQDMRSQAQRFGAETVMKKITKVDFSDPQNLKLWADDTLYESESVILATGATAKWLNLDKAEEKYWGKGYTACATCDGAFFRDKVVGVVGGGDSACEEAHFLTKFASKVYMIVRRDEFRASKAMQKRVLEHEKIEVLWNKSVTNLNGDPLLESVDLVDNVTGDVSVLELNGLFMAIGHKPNTEIFSDYLDLEDNKYFKVENQTKTKVPSVFVAGDCSDWRYRQAVTAAGWGCMAALDAERYLEEVPCEESS